MIVRDYDKMLYSILKPLVLEHKINLYHNVVDTDYDSQPKDYVVYSTGISNIPRLYGDGKVLMRRCSCDITVNEVGTGNNANSGYLVRLVEDILIQNSIAYSRHDLGYIESFDSMQTTFDFYL